MSKSSISIKGYVPVKIEINNGKLFCNVAKGCSVFVGEKFILKTDGPVKDHPVSYKLKAGEAWRFVAN